MFACYGGRRTPSPHKSATHFGRATPTIMLFCQKWEMAIRVPGQPPLAQWRRAAARRSDSRAGRQTSAVRSACFGELCTTHALKERTH